MKRVWLMRHAKSSWDNAYLTDHERPLNERGYKDATEMGMRIFEKGPLPQMVYSSDSMRTRETIANVQLSTGALKVLFSPDLYLASERSILKKIREADNRYKCILILAHNPGITYAFDLLANVNIDNVPTSGLGLIKFNVNSFSEIGQGSGELEFFSYPKKA